jgi:hypothetical protein
MAAGTPRSCSPCHTATGTRTLANSTPQGATKASWSSTILPPGREGLPTDGQVEGGKAAVKDRLVWWREHTGQRDNLN